MQSIDRYLYAVGRYLPRNKREDILAELRANILAMVEDREQELGRHLTLEEEEAVLKQHGHPMVVAARYLPQQHLIGPTVFPFYWHTLRLAFPWVLLLYVLAHCTQFITEPVTGDRVIGVLLGVVPALFYAAGWITLVFALMEFGTTRYVKNANILYNWNPKKLPEVPKSSPQERPSSPVFDFLGSIVTLVFLVVLRQHPLWVMGPAMYYPNVPVPAPVWNTVYQMAIVFVSLQLAMKGMVLFSSSGNRWRIAVKFATKASAIAIIAFLLRTHEYVLPAQGSDTNLVNAVHQINGAMYLGWRIVLVILLLQLAWDVAKLLFPRLRLHPELPHSYLLK